MTELLRKAFQKASEELTETEQDAIGRWLLEALEKDEQRWTATFDRSLEKLEQLAAEASDDFKTGQTRPLHPDKL